jgi:hypothetical protein
MPREAPVTRATRLAGWLALVFMVTSLVDDEVMMIDFVL